MWKYFWSFLIVQDYHDAFSLFQGLGFFTTEENLYTPEGVLVAKDMSSYNIPGFADVPEEFNVHLLKTSHAVETNEGVYSAKVKSNIICNFVLLSFTT